MKSLNETSKNYDTDTPENSAMKRLLIAMSAVSDKFFRPWKKSKPVALPSRHFPNNDYEYTWEDWDEECNAKWPFRFFFFDTIPEAISCRWQWWVVNPSWKFKHRFVPKHKYHIMRTDLKPGYYDPSEQMLYALMKMNTDFVDMTKDVIAWEEDGSKEMWEDLNKVYDWWKKYDARMEAIDASYDDLNDRVEITRDGDTFKVHKSDILEEQLNKEADEMLCILVKHRMRTWYP